MDYAIIIYLMGIIPSFEKLSVTVVCVSVVALIFITIAKVMCDPELEDENRIRKGAAAWLKTALWSFFIAAFLSIAIPSTSTMEKMIAGYVAQHTIEGVASLDGVDTIPQDLINIAKGWIEANQPKPAD